MVANETELRISFQWYISVDDEGPHYIASGVNSIFNLFLMSATDFDISQKVRKSVILIHLEFQTSFDALTAIRFLKFYTGQIRSIKTFH